MKRHAEELRQWLDKWYGVHIGTVTGYVFVEMDILEEFLEVLGSESGKAHSLCVYRGPLLDPLNSFPLVKLFNLLVGEVVAPLIYRSGLSCILILDFDMERFCCVCDGREGWACVFRTKEKDTKIIIAHMFSLLGFEERSYRYRGLTIFREGLPDWLKKGVENRLIDYAWVRNEFEKGDLPSRELKLIAKSVQNWFEDKPFSSSVFTWWLNNGKVGIWGLNYSNKMTCVFSASGKEAENREFAEILGEIYDAYRVGVTAKDEEGEAEVLIKESVTEGKGEIKGKRQADLVSMKAETPLNTEAANMEGGSAEIDEKARPFNLFGKRLMELEERIKNLERDMSRVKVLESKFENLEGIISSLGKVESGGLEETLRLLEERASVIEEMMEEIRSTVNVLNEQLGEFKKREIEILRLIKEFPDNK
ncbi:MAG: hypothetical protein ACUVXA_06160 [Candidatus Jordarchaeum sp.]|uniref:hypothetical protein n=1 Tax=Candidatus Jordarchaeum sp. TaxID=2823881 RepID=UPI00404B5A5A